jgi:hypothetical protein
MMDKNKRMTAARVQPVLNLDVYIPTASVLYKFIGNKAFNKQLPDDDIRTELIWRQ